MSFLDQLSKQLFKEDVSDIEMLPDTQVAKDPGRFQNQKLGYNPKADQIGTFWVVTYPTEKSTKDDVLMSIDLKSLMLQAKGGLMPADIAGVFQNEQDAKVFADSLFADLVDKI